jgi:hypothetical protein
MYMYMYVYVYKDKKSIINALNIPKYNTIYLRNTNEYINFL